MALPWIRASKIGVLKANSSMSHDIACLLVGEADALSNTTLTSGYAVGRTDRYGVIAHRRESCVGLHSQTQRPRPQDPARHGPGQGQGPAAVEHHVDAEPLKWL